MFIAKNVEGMPDNLRNTAAPVFCQARDGLFIGSSRASKGELTLGSTALRRLKLSLVIAIPLN